MSREVAETVVRLVAIELRTSEDRVRSCASLRRDLGLDSIAAANVLFALEQEYGVEIRLDDVERLDSLEDVAVAVERSLSPAT